MNVLTQKERNELNELVAKIRSSKATQREFNRACELNDRVAEAITHTPKTNSPVMKDTDNDLRPDEFCIPSMRSALEETDLTFAQDIRSYIEFVLAEELIDVLSAEAIY
jgi:hypothetical protein